MQRNALLWIVTGALACALAVVACGADDDDDDEKTPDAAAGGDACALPGFTETGCQCASGALGRRQCQKNGTWEACRCPPASQQCVEGQDVECFMCPGESKPRITKCLQGGTFDCACDTRSSDSGRGGG